MKMKKTAILMSFMVLACTIVANAAPKIAMDCDQGTTGLQTTAECLENKKINVGFYITDAAADNIDAIAAQVDFNDGLIEFDSAGKGASSEEFMRDGGAGSADIFIYSQAVDSDTMDFSVSFIGNHPEWAPSHNKTAMKNAFVCLINSTVHCGNGGDLEVVDTGNISTTKTWWTEGDLEYGGTKRLFEETPLPTILINEFEQNPEGDEPQNEWVELYNPGYNPVDISGWRLVNGDGDEHIIVSGIISADAYLSFNFSRQWLDNSDEYVILKSPDGHEVDRTLTAADGHNDNRSWQRVPNGQDTDSDSDWTFKRDTLDFNNDWECEVDYDVRCDYLDADCSDGVCNLNTHACEADPAPYEGQACDDGNACTTGDKCSDGVCVSETPLNFDDNNVCTDDYCHSSTGCYYVNNTNSCDDGEFCTVNDRCSGGVCTAGEPRNCSDGVDCTVDSCNGDICVNDPDNSYCDNGLWCDGFETCHVTLGCQLGAAQDCDDGNECTGDVCNIDACEHIPMADDTECTGGICCSGTCTTAACSADDDCDDNNVCTTDTCIDAGRCSASCSYSDVTACIDDDGCCPAGCDYESDNDCQLAVQCWNEEYEYLKRRNDQFRKFCKCVEGTYTYISYSLVLGRKRAYQYVDAANNEEWETSSFLNYFPAYKVRCADENWYYTDRDYYSN